MKKILLSFLFSVVFFSSSFANYYDFCNNNGIGKNFTWITPERLTKLILPDENFSCPRVTNNLRLGDLGNTESYAEIVSGWDLENKDNYTYKYSYKVFFNSENIGTYSFPNIKNYIDFTWVNLIGISQNGKHLIYQVGVGSADKEKEKELKEKHKYITGIYIDGIKINTDSLGSIGLDFYFLSDNNTNLKTDMNGNEIKKFDSSLFPLSPKKETKLDTYISTISKVKREILLPKLQAYYKDTSKSYKKRIAAYYIYAELTIQKLKENSL